eukprot:jgi/Bigna1/142391/aug1.69_g17099
MEIGLVKMSSNFAVGGKVRIPATECEKIKSIQLALKQKLNDATTIHGTVDSTGCIKGTISKSFDAQNATASLTFGVNVTQGLKLMQPVGMMIDLGDV